MTIHIITQTDPLWLPVADFADTCSWDACARMASFMRDAKFNDWERVFVAEEADVLMGFCALIKPQGFPGQEYCPLIKWLFVSEEYRGQRLSQKLIDVATKYADKLGYDRIYLTTWHTGLYEKYSFVKLCEKEVRAGYSEGIYEKKINLTSFDVDKSIPYHVIDVFTDKLFGGNPAGVCQLDEWLLDNILQNIAAENNLSETAFLVKQDSYYDLRWFTPVIEIDFCGHATVVSAFVLFEESEKDADEIKFKTISGMIAVMREADLLYLDSPSRPVTPCPVYNTFEKAFGVKLTAVYKAVDFLLLVDNEEAVRNIKPNFSTLKQVKAEAGLDSDSFGIIVTAAGSDYDFVSRFFAPNAGIDGYWGG